MFKDKAQRSAGGSPVLSSLLGCSHHRWAFFKNFLSYANTQEEKQPQAARSQEFKDPAETQV